MIIRKSEDNEKIIKAMESYGGSFMVALANAYRHADSNNRIRLNMAFEDEFDSYYNRFVITQVQNEK